MELLQVTYDTELSREGSMDTETIGSSRPASFEDLYALHSGPLWKYVVKVSGSADLADDVVQESFVRFWTHMGRVDPPRQKAYIYRIATNLMMDHFRKQKSRKTWMATEGPPEPPGPEVRDDVSRDVQEVLQQLKPRERSLVWMAHAEGFSHREIGEALGVGEASVRVLLFRARRKLAAILEGRGHNVPRSQS